MKSTVIRTLLGHILLLAGLLAAVSYGHAEEVIVNPSVTQPTIQKNVLRAIMGMRLRTWPDGAPVTVYVLPDDHPLHASFCKKVLNVFPHQMRRAWDRLVFSGTGQSPKEVKSEDELIKKVASTPGAIGYVKGDKTYDGVRVLEVR